MKFLKISLILVFFSTFFHCKMVFAEVASNFSLFTLEGEPVELYPIVSKGNIVVISFFTTWCKPCKKEFPILNKLAKKFSGKPVKIFLIRSDFVSETQMKQFLSENKIEVPILLDEKKTIEKPTITALYNITEFPTTIIIDKNFKISDRFVGLQDNFEELLTQKVESLLKQQQNVFSITLLFTNNLNGQLFPWRDKNNKSYGGITRVISYLKNSKTKYQNLILVDTGDFFPVRTDTTTAKFILSLLKLANYDVVVVGDQEVLSGVDNFICLVEEYKLPVLSTNLKFTTMLTTPTVTIPYLIKKFRSFKIGIISLNTEETFMLCPEEVTQKITILQPNNIETIIKNLRQSCDIIVLLSHCGHQYDREIAKLYPDVDLIIGGHNQILLNQPVRISKTTIVQAGSNGEYVGKIIFLIDRDKKLLTFDYEPVLMDENVKEDSTVISLIQNYKFQLKNR